MGRPKETLSFVKDGQGKGLSKMGVENNFQPFCSPIAAGLSISVRIVLKSSSGGFWAK